MNIIKAEVLKNIPDWQHLEWTGERLAACASDELLRVNGTQLTDRGCFLKAMLKIVDNTDLLLDFYNNAIDKAENQVVSFEYLAMFMLKHDLLDRLYDIDQDLNALPNFAEWDWFDWIPMGARLMPMRFYYQCIENFVCTLPALNEYWDHLVNAHNFIAISEGPTASEGVFNIYVTANLKQSGELEKSAVIAPRCLDLKTGKVYAMA